MAVLPERDSRRSLPESRMFGKYVRTLESARFSLLVEPRRNNNPTRLPGWRGDGWLRGKRNVPNRVLPSRILYNTGAFPGNEQNTQQLIRPVGFAGRTLESPIIRAVVIISCLAIPVCIRRRPFRSVSARPTYIRDTRSAECWALTVWRPRARP